MWFLTYRNFRIICGCLFGSALVVHVIAFSTEFWYKHYDQYSLGNWLVHHGLWVLCDYWRTGGMDNKCYTIVNRHDDFEGGKMKSAQTLMCLALLCNIVSTALFIPWLALSESRMDPVRSMRLAFVNFLLFTISGTLTMITVTIFIVHYSKFHNVLNWSFILACVSGGVLMIGGIIAIIILFKCTMERAPKKVAQPPEEEALRERVNVRPMPPIPTVSLNTQAPLPDPPATANSSFDTISSVTTIYNNDDEKKMMYEIELDPRYSCFTNNII